MFLRAWRSSSTFDPARGSLRVWLFAIARNLVVDLVRHRAVRPVQPVDADRLVALAGGDGGFDEATMTAWTLEEALRRLSEEHRVALVETYLRGRPYGEVSAELGVPARGARPPRDVRGHRRDLDEIAPVAGLLGGARDRLRPDDLSTDPAPPPLPDALIAEVRAAAPVRRPRRVLLAAAALGALVAGGVGYVVGGSVGQVPREDVAVRSAAPGIRAQATVIAHTWGMEVTLTATGFMAGAAYTVTVTDDAGRTAGAGEFLGTGGQEMVCNLNSSVLRADASLVRVTAPDGQVVLDAAV